jgi:hypothetical protein
MKSFGMKFAFGLILASASIMSANTTARADVAVSLTPGQDVMNNGIDRSLGFLFSVNSAITVTELGYFDDLGNGFNNSHSVGIFTTAGDLLASAIVSTSDALDNLFRYVAISPLYLAAGQQYVIAGTTGKVDPYAWNPAAFSTASEITFVEDRYAFNSSLVYPDVNHPMYETGWFGPNFKFEAASTAVPEPSAMISAATACLAGLGVARRRRRSA